MLREVIKEDPSPYVKYIEYIEEDKVLGYLKYSLIYDRIEIDNILVEPEYRGQKIGRNLYKKFGFREVALRKFYYGDEDAILMEKQVM